VQGLQWNFYRLSSRFQRRIYKSIGQQSSSPKEETWESVKIAVKYSPRYASQFTEAALPRSGYMNRLERWLKLQFSAAPIYVLKITNPQRMKVQPLLRVPAYGRVTATSRVETTVRLFTIRKHKIAVYAQTQQRVKCSACYAHVLISCFGVLLI